MLDLVPGEVYRRRELHKKFGGQQQGGISTPARFPVVLLFTGEQGTLYGYHDGFQSDGTFFYTGEGQVGDMLMLRGNTAIRDHVKMGKELHLFEYVGKSLVQYVGRAFYLDHHIRVAPDRNGTPRNAIVFELAVDAPEYGTPDPYSVVDPSRPNPLWKRPLHELRLAAYMESTEYVPPAQRKAIVYRRSDVIKAYVLRRAEGICEGCGAPAPFYTPQGHPYLEPHHIRRRADDGPDHPQWVIAVCPNCHARVHRSTDGAEYNALLASRVKAIEASLVIPG